MNMKNKEMTAAKQIIEIVSSVSSKTSFPESQEIGMLRGVLIAIVDHKAKPEDVAKILADSYPKDGTIWRGVATK